jgi:hypothetical protein
LLGFAMVQRPWQDGMVDRLGIGCKSFVLSPAVARPETRRKEIPKVLISAFVLCKYHCIP